jgi:polysaccharide biosynthesis/export protein
MSDVPEMKRTATIGRIRGWRAWAVLGAVGACLSQACAQTPAAGAPAQTPQAPAATPAPQTPAPGPDKPAESVVGPDYLIGPGDTIQVFVWRNPELSLTVPVRPDGKVSTPLVEDMLAVGKTPSQLARDMEVRLAEYVRNPQVNVIVTQPMSAFSKVTVIGQVGQPGSVPFRQGMTVLDVVLASGGLKEFAAGNRAKLVRKDENGKPREIRVRLHDLVKEGKMKENLEVLAGDVLVVPESFF